MCIHGHCARVDVEGSELGSAIFVNEEERVDLTFDEASFIASTMTAFDDVSGSGPVFVPLTGWRIVVIVLEMA